MEAGRSIREYPIVIIAPIIMHALANAEKIAEKVSLFEGSFISN